MREVLPYLAIVAFQGLVQASDRFECRSSTDQVYYIMQLEAGSKSYTSGRSFRCDAASGKWIHVDGYEAPARLNCGEAVSDSYPYCRVYHTYPNGAVSATALYAGNEQYCPAGMVPGYADGQGIRSMSCKGTILTIEHEDGTITMSNKTPSTFPTLKCVPGVCKQVCSGPTTTTTTTTAAPTIPPNCPENGVWSEWQVVGPCATTCGSCSVAKRTRTCTMECGNCPCVGPSEDVGPCGIAVCPFPPNTCCTQEKHYKKSLNLWHGGFFCGLANVEKPSYNDGRVC
ncbi:hypothetical protein PRIPAC_89398 [Pristionchus pacificus]|uniref:Uncharacterized protein n=1 Tax=Pristionchus pacificus TaxID=54126 RepID=A0A2A6B8I9_PRIPA|nr:hypothetical protein PRIPAC_89398 [Pristionchus pacificus]|eukprot:PDM62196.1 hypothetical protein PRIPAC_51638 [Pristionchus pacificus]